MSDVACPDPAALSGLFADDSDPLTEPTATPNGVLLRCESQVYEKWCSIRSPVCYRTGQRTAYLHSACRRFPDMDIDGTIATEANQYFQSPAE